MEAYPEKLHRVITVRSATDTTILPTLRDNKWELLDKMFVVQRNSFSMDYLRIHPGIAMYPVDFVSQYFPGVA